MNDKKIHIRKVLFDGRVVIPAQIIKKLNLSKEDYIDINLRGKEILISRTKEKNVWSRKVGFFNRTVIPKYFRELLEIKAGDLLEIVLKDNVVHIFKANLKCKICGEKIENSSERVRIFYDSYCVKCAQEGKIEC